MTEEEHLLSDLEPVLIRPKMYFGDAPDVAAQLAAFVNGYMAHRSGMMWGGFGMACQADPDKTLEENAEVFKQQIIKWATEKPGSGQKWRCCVRGPRT